LICGGVARSPSARCDCDSDSLLRGTRWWANLTPRTSGASCSGGPSTSLLHLGADDVPTGRSVVSGHALLASRPITARSAATTASGGALSVSPRGVSHSHLARAVCPPPPAPSSAYPASAVSAHRVHFFAPRPVVCPTVPSPAVALRPTPTPTARQADPPAFADRWTVALPRHAATFRTDYRANIGFIRPTRCASPGRWSR
jgi:hypothetical protein